MASLARSGIEQGGGPLAPDPIGHGPGGAKPPRLRGSTLVRATFVALLAGIVLGWLGTVVPLAASSKTDIINVLNLVTGLFLRLIRMLVAPLVLSALAFGVSQMGSARAVGKVGGRVLVWFVFFSVVSTFLGLAMVNLLAPGAGLHLAVPVGGVEGAVPGVPQFDAARMILEVVPVSVFDALTQNRVIQIVVFAIFAGVAIGSLGERGRQVQLLAEQAAATMLRVAGYVMTTAPLAVFAAIAATAMERGIGTIATLGQFVAIFYVSLAVLAGIIYLVGTMFLGRRMLDLFKAVREPLLLAFSTSSSEATLPIALECLEKFGVPRRIAAFVLPLGYAFNLDGTMMYSAFAVIFIAQAYGIDLSLSAQLGIMVFLFLANKGAAGVPRGALIGIAVTLQTFHLPAAGVVLILAVDALLDMGRTTINVFGNAVATAAIARIEGALAPAAAPVGQLAPAMAPPAGA